MPKDVDLCDGPYIQITADVQSDVRRETYGEDPAVMFVRCGHMWL